ncbi:hypothetical protein GGF46_004338 [Coemansia sp. RSA 552]|nr:hypothetical protein GGF46_004338 [Coemansia sp. RSA 552]
MDLDVYELLGVSVEAGEKEVTRAYRLKALKHHPDKNRDNPNAAQLFHDIKRAYDLLLDPQQRTQYDEQRRAQLAKRQRQTALSSQRKRMKSELEREEQQARDIEQARRAQDQRVREEATRFREESRREEWRHDKKLREHIQRAHEHPEEDPDPRPDEAEDELDRSVRIRWSPDRALGRDALAAVFVRYGALEEVVMAPTSENARRQRKKQPPMASALLVFQAAASAQALMAAQHVPADVEQFERFWARGEPPQTKRRWAESVSQHQQQSRRPGPAAEGGLQIPDIMAIDVDIVPGGRLGFGEFEALTLARMRQRGSGVRDSDVQAA